MSALLSWIRLYVKSEDSSNLFILGKKPWGRVLFFFSPPSTNHFIFPFHCTTDSVRASLLAQLVENLPAMWETWVWSLGWEDSLEKGTATHSSIPAWRIPRSPWGRKESDTTEWLPLHRLGNSDDATLNAYFWVGLGYSCLWSRGSQA